MHELATECVYHWTETHVKSQHNARRVIFEFDDDDDDDDDGDKCGHGGDVSVVTMVMIAVSNIGGVVLVW